MQDIRYIRQKLYYRWALVLCIIALLAYTFYFEYLRFIEQVPILTNNIPLYIRSGLIVYLLIILIFLNKLPKRIFAILGLLIAVPLGWLISVISYLTVGYEGITVTGFIFLLFASAVVFNFTFRSYVISLALILSFHFIILSFYEVPQPNGVLNHIFLLGLSSILGLTSNYLLNNIKDNEARVLKDRELLLKEIHHRVKNNLQIISSLLDLQSGSISDNTTREAVKESQSRVKSMALIHQLLYQSEMFTGIDFSQYLDQLLSDIKVMYSVPGKDIQYSVNAENIELDIDTAIPLGLITNELASNAYKYAFEGRDSGKIDIRFSQISNFNYLLSVADNGIGVPEKFDPAASKSLGLKLVKLLSKQLEGKLDIIKKNGTEFKLLIPRTT